MPDKEYKTDAVMVEIIGNLMMSIAEETCLSIIKSAYSNNIKERRDISTAMFDPEGNMVAQAEHVPMHLGSLLGIIGEVYKKFPREEIQPGRSGEARAAQPSPQKRADQKKRREHSRRRGTPEAPHRSHPKDSTEQPSLMKPFYLDLDR